MVNLYNKIIETIKYGFGCDGMYAKFEKYRATCDNLTYACKYFNNKSKECNLYKTRYDLDKKNPIQKKWAETYQHVLNESHKKALLEAQEYKEEAYRLREKYPNIEKIVIGFELNLNEVKK